MAIHDRFVELEHAAVVSAIARAEPCTHAQCHCSLEDIGRLLDLFQMVVYVHPCDHDHPRVKEYELHGYRVEELDCLKRGRGWVRNARRIIERDWPRGEIIAVSENNLLKFA
jgi:hypothetical protein